MLCVVASWFNQLRSSTSHPGGNQVDGLPPAPVPMQSNWLPGRPRNNNSVLKCFSDFEDVPTIYFSSSRFNPLNFKISYSYMVSICQCYHLVSRTAEKKFFAKGEIAVFLLLHFWRCFYHYIATTTALTTRSKCLLFISGGVLWILQLGGHKFREIVFMRCHTFAILLFILAGMEPSGSMPFNLGLLCCCSLVQMFFVF